MSIIFYNILLETQSVDFCNEVVFLIPLLNEYPCFCSVSLSMVQHFLLPNLPQMYVATNTNFWCFQNNIHPFLFFLIQVSSYLSQTFFSSFLSIYSSFFISIYFSHLSFLPFYLSVILPLFILFLVRLRTFHDTMYTYTDYKTPCIFQENFAIS